MLDHVTIKVSNFEKSKAFYLTALKALGYDLLMEQDGYAGFGNKADKNPIPDFWIYQHANPDKTHIAFAAKDRLAVEAFYKAALSANGKDNGKPGIRTEYHANYYGAFVFDPDGYNIEAVCHLPE